MADYRCPKHDLVFETSTDHRKPGALANDKLAGHPVNGHPDCPQCQLEAKSSKSVVKQTTYEPGSRPGTKRIS